MRRLAAVVVLALAAVGLRAAPVAASDECPGAGVRPACHLREEPRCVAWRNPGGSVTWHKWVCALKP